jgi:cyclic beta-1,2-glucan synthetase
MFGLQIGPRQLCFTPCLPSQWRRAEITLRRDGRTLRFILARGATAAALTPTVPADALVLWPGQMLDWAVLAGPRCFLVPLLDGGAATPLESAANSARSDALSTLPAPG